MAAMGATPRWQLLALHCLLLIEAWLEKFSAVFSPWRSAWCRAGWR